MPFLLISGLEMAYNRLFHKIIASNLSLALIHSIL